MAVVMEKFDFEPGDGVKEMAGWELYGTVVSKQPYTHPKWGTSIDVDFGDDPEFGGVHPTYPDLVKRLPKCECGNPFGLCHPEA